MGKVQKKLLVWQLGQPARRSVLGLRLDQPEVRFAALHVPSLVVALDVLAVNRAGQHQPVGTVQAKVQHGGRIDSCFLISSLSPRISNW